jgi:hypothetical protein
LFVSPPFVVCQPSTDPPTCCCPPLPETTTHTYTHCPCRLCGNFGSARRCVASPRWFYFLPPLVFDCCWRQVVVVVLFGWGVVVRCSCHVKRRPLSRTS